MLLYQCQKCNRKFAANSPKLCPYCGHENLYIIQSTRVVTYQPMKVKQTDNFIAAVCKVFEQPTISIRHFIDSLYTYNIARKRSRTIKKPLTVEVRVYNKEQAIVLLDTEEDEKMFKELSERYLQHGWKVFDLRNSEISLTKLIRQFLKTHVIPRLQNYHVAKDIECILENDKEGLNGDDNS